MRCLGPRSQGHSGTLDTAVNDNMFRHVAHYIEAFMILRNVVEDDLPFVGWD